MKEIYKLFDFQYNLSNDIDENVEKEIYSINNTLNLLLVTEKKKIDKYYTIWDKYKKFSNEYEFLYSSHDSTYKSLIADSKVSRSYFKLWEILNDYDLLSNLESNVKIANICEAPGGFIESIIDYITGKRKDNTLYDVNYFFYGFSIMKEKDKSIPIWKIKKMQPFYKVHIWLNNKHDNAGNIYDYTNILDYITNVTPNACKLITCDGGFDINGDYEHQEALLNKLLLCETYLILRLQKNKGSSVIKFFDLFSINTMKIIYILSLFYKSISFVKPLSSRPANSEKYLLCEDFVEDNLISHNDIVCLIHNFLYTNSEANLDITIPTCIKKKLQNIIFIILIVKYIIFHLQLI